MLTEFEIMQKLQECLKEAEGCCRQMAHWRGDPKWLRVAAVYADQQKKILVLAQQPGGLSRPQFRIVSH